MLNLKTLLGLLLLVLSQQIYAQKIQQLKKGNRYYKQKKYEKALDIYETLSETTGGNKVLGVDGKINLADCYRILEQPQKAAPLYQEFLEYAEDRPSMHLEYGQVLMNLGQYEEAIVHFSLYGADRKGEIASAGWIQQCERIQEIEPIYTDVKLTEQANINDFYTNEWGPSYFGNHIVFVTDELDGVLDDIKDFGRQNFRITAIDALGNSGKYHDFGEDINQSKRDNGSIAFSRDGNTLIYAQSYTNVDGKSYTELRMAYFIDSVWSPSQSLTFVLENCNYKHPSLSADEQTLYFASDMPGTLGGLDLWEVHKEAGFWGMPINLGKNINTAADDAWPFAHPDGDLFFASKGYLSYGGYDIYRTRPLGNGVDWLPVENLGTPINSAFNDISFILSDDQTEVFYASNRANSYDIYRAELLSETPQVLATHIQARQSHGQAALGRTQLDANFPLVNASSADSVSFGIMGEAMISSSETLPDGSERIVYEDGSAEIFNADGTVVLFDKEGPKLDIPSIGHIGDESYAPLEFASKPIEKPTNESYATVHENEFVKTATDALSTFSIDVDRASYSNVRRYLDQMQAPPVDAVRIEEMVNYFDYNYPAPTEEHPMSIHTEISDCPWNKDAKLVQIALQGKPLDLETAAANNLVFLIDVSGSMEDRNKLPLVKESLRLLIKNMRAQDQMSMVVYAGAAGVIQAPTNDQHKLLEALDRLTAGGSTAGGEGIEIAYTLAKKHFTKDGNNRVIIATDGDFNVGVSENKSLEALIEERRKDNIFLTCLGFGMGNYKDDKMELLADKGNGNYAYIDNIKEAKKTLVNEMSGTLYTIAKDVKLQVVFNPELVKYYRLVGYENRKLEHVDFDNDTKDAGELGAGHTVTAMYELLLNPASEEALFNEKDALLTVNLRYKKPTEETSVLLEHPVLKETKSIDATSNNYRFAAAVASFGMLLRDSKFKNNLKYQQILDLAESAKGVDVFGYRQEFIEMVRKVHMMTKRAEEPK